jgi:hypothetical protein
MFGCLEIWDHPDADRGPAVGFQEEMQLALKDQTPAVLEGLKVSARETDNLKLGYPWVTVVVLTNYM